MAAIDEASLIKELKQGSVTAFDRIYALYFKRLYAYCLKFTSSGPDAEEIVHDVFLRLWRIKENIRKEDTLCSLLFIISKSYLIKYYYRQKKNRVFDDYAPYRNVLRHPDSSDSELMYGMCRETLRQELERMPERQREIIVMSKFKALSNSEIAEVLDLKEQTVKNQLSLGLKELKRRMKKRNLI